MATGIVKLWKQAEGYGFIAADDRGPDVFAHQSAIEMDGYRYLAAGEPVEYEAVAEGVDDEGIPRLKATRVVEAAGRLHGTVSEFDHQKGYGFVEGDDGERFFLHYKGILGFGTKTAKAGDRVSFFAEGGELGRDRVAVSVKHADPRPPLYQFAAFPRREEWLTQLADLAEDESWSFQHERAGEDEPHPILHNYLVYTFAKLKEQADAGDATIVEKLVDGRRYTCFDTGLATPQQQHIYAFFGENTNPAVAPWYFYGFHTVSDRIFPWSSGDELPKLAEYFDDPAELIYDRRLELQLDYEHILEDHLEDRFPEPLRGNVSLARNALIGTEAQIRDRVYRNYKTAVPQYWRGRIQLLLPLCLLQDGKADLALLVEKEPDGQCYRGNTVLTLDMAYSNARLLARPDPDWLSQNEATERPAPMSAGASS
jgi:cold shock CspA family protein